MARAALAIAFLTASCGLVSRDYTVQTDFIAGGGAPTSGQFDSSSLLSPLSADVSKVGSVSLQSATLQSIDGEDLNFTDLKPYLQAGGLLGATAQYSPFPATARSLRLTPSMARCFKRAGPPNRDEPQALLRLEPAAHDKSCSYVIGICERLGNCSPTPISSAFLRMRSPSSLRKSSPLLGANARPIPAPTRQPNAKMPMVPNAVLQPLERSSRPTASPRPNSVRARAVLSAIRSSPTPNPMVIRCCSTMPRLPRCRIFPGSRYSIRSRIWRP